MRPPPSRSWPRPWRPRRQTTWARCSTSFRFQVSSSKLIPELGTCNLKLGTRMITLRGIPVSAGVAIGPALVLDAEGVRVPQRRVTPDQVEGEVARLHAALAAAAFDATQTQRDITARL